MVEMMEQYQSFKLIWTKNGSFYQSENKMALPKKSVETHNNNIVKFLSDNNKTSTSITEDCEAVPPQLGRIRFLRIRGKSKEND